MMTNIDPTAQEATTSVYDTLIDCIGGLAADLILIATYVHKEKKRSEEEGYG